MSNFDGMTRAQTLFLRACSRDPFGTGDGAGRKHWPTAATFRKWMRRPGFRAAVEGIREALRFQADLQIAAASAAAARGIANLFIRDDGTVADADAIKSAKDQVQSLLSLLRLAHLRQRFSMTAKAPPAMPRLTPRQRAVLAEIEEWANCGVHHSLTIGEAQQLIEQMDLRAAARNGEGEPDAA